MPLPRTEVVAGVQEEQARFVALLRTLDSSQWGAPTRCEGWVVADIAAHVAGTLTDIAEGHFDLLSAPDATERQAAERRGRSAAEVADELERSAKVGADLAASFDDALWSGPAP